MSVQQQTGQCYACGPSKKRWPKEQRHRIQHGEKEENKEGTGCMAGWKAMQRKKICVILMSSQQVAVAAGAWEKQT